ncbi:glycoside hydrolase family 28 protein [Paracoccus tegillarcae]|uniref:Glycoside hydrolase family 28 n=1 Tax=Paracoccus tegillarcae TaxID=1529068 RepID=A0A2K9EIZ4_9RHOB|nr:glycoside hydrolase family 28 protein [Paracoccus tegillarcae]AUH34349.1 glycoside hydrolase family 28 [Paracoccus tegillarcae]
MPELRAIAVTARTAVVMVDAETCRYHLPAALDWVLNDGAQRGQTFVVPLFLEGLAPDTEHRLDVAGDLLTFRTAPCAGLVDAADHGVSVDADDNAQAFAAAIAAVPRGGTLSVAAGLYVSGPIFLKSDMTFYLPEGVQIAAPGSREGWPILPERDGEGRVIGTWEGLPAACFAAPVTAIGCDRLTLTGRGIIDGGGDRGDWWDWPKERRQGAYRPRTLFMAHCRDLVMSGVTVRNSPSWTVHPFHCHGLMAAALRIENPADSPNTDGFDPESCTDLQLRGLSISVGDDCIAVKSGKRGTGADRRVDHIAPTRHMTIANCLMQDGHGAVVMGSEMSGDITDVDINRCEFKGTDRGLRIKTRRGRGGQVARITMRDVTMQGVGTALAANAFYYCDADGRSDAVQSRDPAPVDETTPQIADITIENLTLTDVRHAVAAFLGLPEAPLTGIRLSDIRVSYDDDAQAGDTLMASYLPRVRHGGILHRFAELETDAALRPLLEDLNDAG